MFNHFEFVNPSFLWGMLCLPFLIYWNISKRNRDRAELKVPALGAFDGYVSSLERIRPILYIIRYLAIALLFVALARPRTVGQSTKTKLNKGIDIVMAIDVSSSMLARDLKPNRLDALKQVAEEFVNERPNDRIGIVLYAAESYTKVPITSDKRVVIEAIKNIDWGELDDGTAIGMGLGSAVNRLKDSKAKSKVIILLTDGVNNTGFVDPKTATELAKNLGIKVYTIGIGTNGIAPFPYAKDSNGNLLYRNEPVEIDEELLKYIAKETSGRYFRATNTDKLEEIYDEINKLEKTETQEIKYYNYDEKYRIFVLIALGLIVLEILLRYTVYKSFI